MALPARTNRGVLFPTDTYRYSRPRQPREKRKEKSVVPRPVIPPPAPVVVAPAAPPRPSRTTFPRLKLMGWLLLSLVTPIAHDKVAALMDELAA